MKSLLLLAGLGLVSQAQGQSACPADDPVFAVMAPGFSCTLADKTFSGFDIVGAPAGARVQFGQLGPLFAITLSRDGEFFTASRLLFDYTVTATAPMTIREGSVGVDVSFPTVITSASMNGMLLPTIVNGGTQIMTFTPGVGSVKVDDTVRIASGTSELNSISNDFSQVIVGIPETDTLSLAALGGIGLLWVSRRRPK